MDTQSVRLIDQAGAVVATAEVADEGGHFGGTVNLADTPAGLRALFDEFEEIVNGQMLSFLDGIQGKIAAHPLRAVFEDGTEWAIHDLQVFPEAGDVSFRRVSPAGRG